jgi:hypothetical protein
MKTTRLPGCDRAVVDIAKLRDYCLNPYHEDGKHKARVFAAVLGLGRKDAGWLRDQLMRAAATQRAVLSGETRFGTLYVLDFLLTTAEGSAQLRSGWIVRHSEDFPRLTTCYVKGGALS